MTKIILFLSIFCFLSWRNNDNLGSGYYYLSDFNAMDVGYPYGSIVYKSNQENLYKKIIIYSKIEYINYDEEYICIVQKPNKSLMKKKLKDDFEFWNRYYFSNKKDSLINLVHKKILLSDIHKIVGNNKAEKLDLTADSIFNNEIFYKKMFQNKSNYYIIQKVNDSIFGPLTFKGFEDLKRNKKIDLDFE